MDITTTSQAAFHNWKIWEKNFFLVAYKNMKFFHIFSFFSLFKFNYYIFKFFHFSLH